MLEYISALEAVKKSGILEKWLQKLYEEKHIFGVEKVSCIWLIPENAKKPADKEYKISPK